jgi:hypothetical protein
VHELGGASHFVGRDQELVEEVRLAVEEADDRDVAAFQVVGDGQLVALLFGRRLCVGLCENNSQP